MLSQRGPRATGFGPGMGGTPTPGVQAPPPGHRARRRGGLNLTDALTPPPAVDCTRAFAGCPRRTAARIPTRILPDCSRTDVHEPVALVHGMSSFVTMSRKAMFMKTPGFRSQPRSATTSRSRPSRIVIPNLGFALPAHRGGGVRYHLRSSEGDHRGQSHAYLSQSGRQVLTSVTLPKVWTTTLNFDCQTPATAGNRAKSTKAEELPSA